MTKYYCLYDKKYDPYFWKLKKANHDPEVFFKNRQDAINYYLSMKKVGTIWFQKDKNDLARGFIPKYEGALVSFKINNKLLHQIKLLSSVKLLNPEETVKKLYKTWNINSKTAEDIFALNNVDRMSMIMNSYLTLSEMLKFLERKKQTIQTNSIEVENEQKNEFEDLELDEEFIDWELEELVRNEFLKNTKNKKIMYNKNKLNKGKINNMKKKVYQPVGYVIPPNQTGTIEYTVVPGQTLNTAINPLGQETMIISPQSPYYIEERYVPQQIMQPQPIPYNPYFVQQNPYDYSPLIQNTQSTAVDYLTSEIKNMRNDLNQIQTQTLSFPTSTTNVPSVNNSNELESNLKEIQSNLKTLLSNQLAAENSKNSNYIDDISSMKQELQNLNTIILDSVNSKNGSVLDDLSQIKEEIRNLSENAANFNTSEFEFDLKQIKDDIFQLREEFKTTKTTLVPINSISQSPKKPSLESRENSPIASSPPPPLRRPGMQMPPRPGMQMPPRPGMPQMQPQPKQNQKMAKKTKGILAAMFSLTGLLLVGAIIILTLWSLKII